MAAGVLAGDHDLALIMELTHGGFAIMIPMIAATVTASVIARQMDGYSIYTARQRARPGCEPDVRPGSAAPPERRIRPPTGSDIE